LTRNHTDLSRHLDDTILWHERACKILGGSFSMFRQFWNYLGSTCTSHGLFVVRVRSSQLSQLAASGVNPVGAISAVFALSTVATRGTALSHAKFAMLSIQEMRSLMKVVLSRNEFLHGISVRAYARNSSVSLEFADDCCRATLEKVACAFLCTLVEIDIMYRDARLAGIKSASA
jgi:hypothetical protein